MGLTLIGAILLGAAFVIQAILAAQTTERPRSRKPKTRNAGFGDIVNNSDYWLRKLRNTTYGSVGGHHTIVYKALWNADLDELEQHPALCRQLCVTLWAPYSLLLVNASGPNREKFWLRVCRNDALTANAV